MDDTTRPTGGKTTSKPFPAALHGVMLDSLGDGVIAIDLDGRVMYCNPVAQKLLGKGEGDCMGQALGQVLPNTHDEVGRSLDDSALPLMRALRQAKKVTGVYYYSRGAHAFPVSVAATPVMQHGNCVGAVEVFRDTTKEVASSNAKSEFVATASHQLRTPLGIAKWYLDALKKDADLQRLPKTMRDRLDEVYASNERVIALVRSLLSVSRIDQGGVKDSPEATDVAELVTRVVRELDVAAQKKRIKLRLAVDAGLALPKVRIDPLRLHEVIENLVANAITYTAAGGSVTVRLSQQGKQFKVAVADTGMGISSADQKQLFAKFFRTSGANTHNPDGTGLGLYVVKSYVEAWKGSIEVDSREGHGSTFTIIVPLGGGQV